MSKFGQRMVIEEEWEEKGFLVLTQLHDGKSFYKQGMVVINSCR